MAVTKRKGKLPPFIPLIRTTIRCPAWKALSYGARCVYIVLRDFLRIDNTNNGKVYRSYQDVHNDLGRGTERSIARWFNELAHYGFIVQTSGYYLGVDGLGVAPHWRLTEYPSFDGRGNMIAATRDFEKWDGALFEDPYKAQKTESCIPQGSTPLPSGKPKEVAEIGQILSNPFPEGNLDAPPNPFPDGNLSSCHSLTPLSLFCTPTAITDAVGPLLDQSIDAPEGSAPQAPISVVPCWVFGRRP